VEYVKGQVKELLTNYGPIGILWFDDGGSFGNKDDLRSKVMHGQEIVDMVHELQPKCLVNDRLATTSDYGTPEQRIPGGKSDKPFEVCMTLNKHWGYNKADKNFKQPKEVIQNLVDIASKGGNYLLNVGPTAEGIIPEESVNILAEVGKWMKTNGESIYGTSASPFDAAPKWGRVTSKDKKVYLHVFEWPKGGKLAAPAMPSKPTKACLLSDPEKKLEFAQGEAEEDSVVVKVPENAPDAIDSVIVVECE
jgi:alpha-L-fucosidase